MKWYKADIKFKLGKKPIEFSIIYNIEGKGNINSINAALDNWLARTNKFTAESLVDYINSKNIYQAYTEEQWKKLKTKTSTGQKSQ